MGKIEATHIPQLSPFELVPEALARIQLRSIRREPFDVEALRRAIGQELFDHVTAMNWGPIPDNDQAAGHLAQQMLKEGDHILRVKGVILTLEIEFAPQRDGTDGREVVTGPPSLQDRRLTYGGVGSNDAGQGIKPRLVDEQDRLLLRLSPLLMAGQVSSRQCAIATSSRCRARRAGFCGLQRIMAHKRPTWRGW